MTATTGRGRHAAALFKPSSTAERARDPGVAADRAREGGAAAYMLLAERGSGGGTLIEQADGASDADLAFMQAAIAEAERGAAEGGVPIGAALVEDGAVVATGRNRRVQEGDPIAHGEMDCLRAAGRRPGYRRATLYTTLSPCMMCAGTVVQFGIPRVVVGENATFGGNEEFLRSRGVEVLVLGDARCEALMRRFQAEHPDVWNEDIAE